MLKPINYNGIARKTAFFPDEVKPFFNLDRQYYFSICFFTMCSAYLARNQPFRPLMRYLDLYLYLPFDLLHLWLLNQARGVLSSL